jgi:hypothetical protein
MQKLQVNIVLEILGRPPEHLKDALKQLIDKLKSEKGVKVTDKNIHEPIPVKDAKDLYTSFAELSLEFDSIAIFFGIIFAYMPAHIELISPEKFELANFDLNDLGNKLLARLHDYDSITKKLILERNFFMKELNQLAPERFQQAAPKTPENKSKAVNPKKSKIKKTRKSKK